MKPKRGLKFAKPGKSTKAAINSSEAKVVEPVTASDLRSFASEMRNVLPPELLTTLDGLSEYYRHVFLVWCNNGYNQTDAVLAVRPDRTYGSARFMGWSIINSEPVMRLRMALFARDHKTLERLKDRAAGVELDAMEAVDNKGKPDHITRLRAARQVRMFALRAGPLFNVNLFAGGATPAGQGPAAAPATSPIDDILNMKANKTFKAAIAANVEDDEGGET